MVAVLRACSDAALKGRGSAVRDEAALVRGALRTVLLPGLEEEDERTLETLLQKIIPLQPAPDEGAQQDGRDDDEERDELVQHLEEVGRITVGNDNSKDSTL